MEIHASMRKIKSTFQARSDFNVIIMRMKDGQLSLNIDKVMECVILSSFGNQDMHADNVFHPK